MEKRTLVTCLLGFGFSSVFCAICFLLLKRATQPSKQLQKAMEELQQDYTSWKLHLGTDWEEVAEKVEHALARLRTREARAKRDAGENPELSPDGAELTPEQRRAAITAREYAGVAGI
jgi:hypothetical protein